MKAMVLRQTGLLSADSRPLQSVELPRPVPGPREVLIRVAACGVCHTELDEIEGRATPPRLPVVPGHQVVGAIAEFGDQVTKHDVGTRVGVGWIWYSDGSADENLSTEFRATGRDADGGYADYMKVHEDYAYPIPDAFSDEQAAPLLCAGSIGYRALRLTDLENGQSLGLTGFGGSAHLVIQLAQHMYPESPVFVFARDEQSQQFAREMGAQWAGDIIATAPQPLHAIIDTTPAWTPVVEALGNLRAGGRLVINAIRKEESDKAALLRLNYETHLWMEREIKSVANITGRDIAEFLPLAAKVPILPRTETYSLEDANRALIELKQGRIPGSKVLVMDK
ncbi:MAG: zinc-dependent alcohol dehydrogenase family protein [Pirellulaceae bacterium]